MCGVRGSKCTSRQVNWTRRPVSRVLCRPGPRARTRRPFLWTDPRGSVLATYPDRSGLRQPCPIAGAHGPYSVLLLAGLAMPSLSPGPRWALTPPFHPYPSKRGGLLSVALSLGSPPAGVTRRHVVVEPGLSSTPLRAPRPPGRLVRAEPGSWRPSGQVSRNSPISRARVSPSAIPSTRSARQCRWKARITAEVCASNLPEGALS